jgi:site-specific DNA-methyltransferase (adenine-specific)
MSTAANVTTADCVNGMATMPAGCAALVVMDPPYNIGIDYGDGEKADQLHADEYAVSVRQWITAAARILTPTGTLWAVCDARYGAVYDNAITAAGLTMRDRGVWHETFGTWRRGLFGKCWRPWFYAVKGNGYTFNEPAFTVRSRRQELGDKRADPKGKLRGNVWSVPRVTGNSRERVGGAPTQLPLSMIGMVVEGFTNHDDLVVDPFTGTGTTGVAALRAGRRFQGFELREQFAAIARRRIEAATVEVAR